MLPKNIRAQKSFACVCVEGKVEEPQWRMDNRTTFETALDASLVRLIAQVAGNHQIMSCMVHSKNKGRFLMFCVSPSIEIYLTIVLCCVKTQKST